jgi:hypothetical protein
MSFHVNLINILMNLIPYIGNYDNNVPGDGQSIVQLTPFNPMTMLHSNDFCHIVSYIFNTLQTIPSYPFIPLIPPYI